MIDLGIVQPGSTIYIPFATYDSNDPSASVTLTGLAATDIEVYKDGGTTQRASDNGYTLLDTDGIDFDGVTGIHGISINLADNSTAGFWAAGSQYWVVVASVTVDAATINFIAATFRIGYPMAVLNTTIASLSSQTSFTLTNGPAEDDALNGMWAMIHDVASAVQASWVEILDYTGSTKTVTLAAGATFTAAATDNFSVMAPSPLRPTTTGNKANFASDGDFAGNVDGTVATLTTYTGNTPQTGDSFARIGAAGAGLTDLGGMSTTMKAQVNTEADAALADVGVTTTVTGRIDASVSSRSNHSAADIWASATRTLTAATNITSTGGATVPQTGDAYAIVNSGTHGNAALKTLIDTVDTVADAVKAKTDNLPAAPAAVGDIPTAAQITADVLTGTGDTGVTLAKALEMLAAFMAGKVSVSSAGGVSTYTYKKRDGTTTSFTSLASETDGTRATTGSLS